MAKVFNVVLEWQNFAKSGHTPQLAEWSLPIPVVCRSNPVYGKI